MQVGVCWKEQDSKCMHRTECIFALQALSRQVGWEGFDGSNLILDRKHPSPHA